MMKRILQRLLATLLPVAAVASASAQYPYIYRNDGGFNRIDPAKEFTLTHRIEGTDTVVYFNGERLSTSAIDRIDFRQTDIPALRFTFPDNPDLEWVTNKVDYINADLIVEGHGMTEDLDSLTLSVRGRGNSTWGMNKKPMRMKFPSKTSICGFTKAKNYVLLANYIDPSHMRNALALWFARRLGLPFTNHTMPVNVYVNDTYSGLYLLTEKVGINKASVDIDENTGILFELGKEFDEPYKFKSAYHDLPVMVKDPDFDELFEADPEGLTPDERLAMWREDFEKAELLVADGRGGEAFDMQSAVDYFLVMNFAANDEIGFPKSVFLYKENLDEGSLYHFGPVWDVDVAFNFYTGESSETMRKPDHNLWAFGLLWDLYDHPEFQALYQERLKELRDVIRPEMMEWMKEYAYSIEPGAKMDGQKWSVSHAQGSWTWHHPSSDTDRFVRELTEWVDARIDHLTKDLQ